MNRDPVGDERRRETGATGHGRVVRALLAEADRPHVVVRHDRTTGEVVLLGPYADGLAAVCAAEDERAIEAFDGSGEVDLSVAPLRRPEDLA